MQLWNYIRLCHIRLDVFVELNWIRGYKLVSDLFNCVYLREFYFLNKFNDEKPERIVKIKI